MKDKVTYSVPDDVEEVFSDYLKEHKLRRTPERLAVLQEIYARNDHFEADTLYNELLDKKTNISRATVYNTLDLLVSCELVRKHQFGKSHALYEKSHSYRQHDHLICAECGKVIEFCDPRIQQIKTGIGELLNFKIRHHSLNLFGSCLQPDCEGKNHPNDFRDDD